MCGKNSTGPSTAALGDATENARDGRLIITNKDSLGPAYDKGQDPGQNCVADVETINQNTVWSSVSKAADMSNKPSRVTLPLSAALRMSRQS